MNTNLLYLNHDILNIIGDYVKKDNNERIQDFKFIDYAITELMHELKPNNLETQNGTCYMFRLYVQN
jgi:hypothetical protein